MILFNLRCGEDHEFEAWFRDGATYDARVAAGHVTYPVCGGADVRKAPMAPSVVGGRGSNRVLGQLREVLGELRRQVEATADYVGPRFSDQARAMYYGEIEERPIYGEASADEAAALADEGVEVIAIPWLRQES